MPTDKIITSPANERIKDIRALGMKKYRDETGLFIVEGARHVADALEAGWNLTTLLYSEKAANDAVVKQSRAVCKDILNVTDDILGKITQRDNTQPVIGVFRQQLCGLTAIKKDLWAGLDGIRDPGNLGTILRTADAVGAAGIILIGNTCDPWSFEAIRASMGSFARVKLAAASAEDFINWRKNWEGRVIGTSLQTDIDYRKADYTLPLILMMGSEQSGLSPAIVKTCDTLVKIPMSGTTESLNLAVSTGVMLYEICRNSVFR